jgi:hypothetical protein
MRWFLLLALAARLFAGTVAADLARAVREAGLDPEECYRVRDLNFSRDDLRFYFTDGYLIFRKAVNGIRTAAVFTAEVEGGDAELLVLAPSRSERMSLAARTGSPNLDEHLKAAVLIFGDRTDANLSDQIRARGEPRKSPDMGRLLADKWNGAVRNLTASVQVRLVEDLLAGRPPGDGFLYAAFTGRELGNFDAIYDPKAREQIVLGQVAYRAGQPYYNIWTSFAALPYRKGLRPTSGLEFRLSDFRLEATLEPDLNLEVATRVAVTPEQNAQTLPFEISPRIRVTEARVDGDPAEVFQPESLRANLVRDTGNDVFLLVPSRPFEKGRRYEVEFRQQGNVIQDAGNHVYYVGSRVNWYPNRALQFASYDLIFRYPKDLDLVATGKIVETATEGDWRMTHRKTESPVRIAAFNLGTYQRVDLARSGYRVTVCANRQAEPALGSKPAPVMITPRTSPFPGANRKSPEILAQAPGLAPDSTARLKQLGNEIVSSLEFMAAYFGPPPHRTITVAPIPGALGQGFAGLVYLSTMAYLDPGQRPLRSSHTEFEQTFYSDLMQAHEIAHQWWGNVVTTSDQQDDWLMEALANYSALLYLEKRKGPRALDAALEEYKSQLLTKTKEGNTLESTGPITWGSRLANSQAPEAWRTIIYAKGSWIIHMLRRRIGDGQFLAMLGELRRQYEYRAISTDEFRQLAGKFLPRKSSGEDLESFFDEWVYGTGIPTLKLKYSVSGAAPAVKLSGTVAQSDVDEGFSALVPIEVQVGKTKSVTQWVRTGDEPASFTLNLRQAPAKVTLDPSDSVLAVKK